MVEGLPFVGTADEYTGFRNFGHITFPLQEIIEEGNFDVLLVPCRGIAAKLHIAQMGSVVAGPLPMVPGAFHNFVKCLARIVLLRRQIVLIRFFF